MQRLFDKTWPGRLLAWTLAAVVVAGLCGCGKSLGPSGKVTGKVALGTGTVAGANIQFCRKDGVPVGVAKVDASGQFRFDQPIPVGDYQVAILEGGNDLPAGAGGPDSSQQASKVPPKYQDSFKSGLSATVAEGDNSFAFELK